MAVDGGTRRLASAHDEARRRYHAPGEEQAHRRPTHGGFDLGRCDRCDEVCMGQQVALIARQSDEEEAAR